MTDEKKKSTGCRDCADLEKIWSKKMALRKLKKLMDVSIAASCTEARDKKDGSPVIEYDSSAMNAATKAIDTANKMLGYQDADGKDGADAGGVSITVDFHGREELAE